MADTTGSVAISEVTDRIPGGIDTLRVASDRVPKIIEDRIYKLRVPTAPITKIIMAKAGNKKANNPRYEYMTKDKRPRWFTAGSTAVASGATGKFVFTCSDYQGIVPKDTIHVPGYGQYSVVELSGTTVTIETVDDSGTDPTSAFASGTSFMRVAPAKPEGDTNSEFYAEGFAKDYNYTQIFEEVIMMTETHLAMEQWTEHDKTLRKLDKAKEYLEDYEYQAIFGERGFKSQDSLSTVNASLLKHPRRLFGGLIRGLFTKANANVIDIGGGLLDEIDLMEAIVKVAKWSEGENGLVVYSAPMPALVFDKWKIAKAVIPGGSSSGYNTVMTKYTMSFGSINVRIHWFLENDDDPMDMSGYGGYMMLLNMSDLQFVPYRPVKYIPNADTAKEDYFLGIYRGEHGFIARHPERHALIKNIGGRGNPIA